MKWNDKLKAMQSVSTLTPEKQTMSVLTTDNNCQNSQKGILAVNGSCDYGHTLKFNVESLTPLEREDYEIILRERIAIMMFDGGLSEADATRIATDEVGSKKKGETKTMTNTGWVK